MSLYGLLCKTQIAIEDEKIIIITHHIIQSEIPLIEIMEIGTIILHEKYSRKGISIPQKNLFIRLIYLGSGGVGFYIKTAKKIYYLSDRENFRDFRSLYILYSTLLKYKKNTNINLMYLILLDGTITG